MNPFKTPLFLCVSAVKDKDKTTEARRIMNPFKTSLFLCVSAVKRRKNAKLIFISNLDIKQNYKNLCESVV